MILEQKIRNFLANRLTLYCHWPPTSCDLSRRPRYLFLKNPSSELDGLIERPVTVGNGTEEDLQLIPLMTEYG
jgi:hypothetical protein